MQNITAFIKSIFLFHKMKIFIFLVLLLVFTVLLFPFSDLGDKISNMVAESTQNTVYVQFDKMGLTLLPGPAIKMSKVVAESPMTPDIEVVELSFAPSFLCLVRGKMCGRAYADGLYAGVLDLNLSTSHKIKNPEAMSADLDYKDFDVKLLMKAIESTKPLPFTASGTGLIKALIDFDPNMKDQPDGEVELQIKQLHIPAFSIPLQAFGSFPLPGLSFEKVQLKGKIKDGKLTIKETSVGTGKDEFSAKISGDMDIQVLAGGATKVGIYNLAIDLNIKESLEGKLGAATIGILDSFLSAYKAPMTGGKRYAFRVKANGFQDPAPQFSAM